MTCVCGNTIDAGLDRVGAVNCSWCRENPARLSEAIRLRQRDIDCPEAGCPLPLELDGETPVLRCRMHGPMLGLGLA